MSILSKMGEDERREFIANNAKTKRVNKFYRDVPVTTTRRELFTLEEFKRELIRRDAVSLWVLQWSERKPFVTFQGHLSPTSETVSFVCHGASDVVNTLTWEQFYKWCKRNGGLDAYTF